MKKKLLILFFILFFLYGCVLLEKGHNYILFVNNSNDDIYVTLSYYYPDSIFHHSWGAISFNEQETKVNAKSSSDNTLRLYWGDTWEIKFQTQIESDTLIVFVLNVDSINSWEVRNNSIKGYNPDDAVLKRYYLSLDDLNRMNWAIYYP